MSKRIHRSREICRKANILFVTGMYFCLREMKQGGPAEIRKPIKCKNMAYYDDDYYDDYDRPTYDNYNGSYAQDVEGWSDQMIDDVLDGEPDAYWNID